MKKIGPSLYQTPENARNILNIGFNMFSIANNHIMDYGKEGLNKTIQFLNEKIIIGAGLSEEDAYKEYIYEKKEIKIGFISIAEMFWLM